METHGIKKGVVVLLGTGNEVQQWLILDIIGEHVEITPVDYSSYQVKKEPMIMSLKDLVVRIENHHRWALQISEDLKGG